MLQRIHTAFYNTGLAKDATNCVSSQMSEVKFRNIFNVFKSFKCTGISILSLQSMVTELCSGPCLVLEIHGTDTPKSFREFCGPTDPVSISSLYSHSKKNVKSWF